MNYELNKFAVITGASSGIGRASAKMLVAKGYKVYDLSRTENPQEGVQHIACDVTKPETIRQAISQIKAEAGRIDILLLSAGFGIAGAIEYTQESEMTRQFDVNVYGPIRVIQEALPLMREQALHPVKGLFRTSQERGRIVFISSMAGVFSIPFQSMYSASKAAINSYAFALVNELRDYKITVSCVMPGDVHTNFKRTTDLSGGDVYPKMKSAIEQMIRDEENGLTSEAVAKQVMKACTRRKPRLYYTSDLLSDIECVAKRIVSNNLAARVVGMMYHTS